MMYRNKLMVNGVEVATATWFKCETESEVFQSLEYSKGKELYRVLRATGFKSYLPAVVIWQMRFTKESDREKHESQLLEMTLDEITGAGARSVVTKLNDGTDEAGQVERERREKLFTGCGFVTHPEGVRPLVTLDLRVRKVGSGNAAGA